MHFFRGLMFILIGVTIAAATYAYMTFSVVSTARGNEWLVLRDEQASECKTGGGCAVFSGRELMRALTKAPRDSGV